MLKWKTWSSTWSSAAIGEVTGEVGRKKERSICAKLLKQRHCPVRMYERKLNSNNGASEERAIANRRGAFCGDGFKSARSHSDVNPVTPWIHADRVHIFSVYNNLILR